MDKNNPLITPNARQVSGRCLLAGIEVPFVSFEVDSNSMNAADTFSVVLATSALPNDMGLMQWWGKKKEILLELSVSISTAAGMDTKKLVVGNVDHYHFNPAHFEITLEGRDFTGRMIDYKSAGESYKNYTAGEIATIIAKRHDLNPIVTASTQRFGELMLADSAHLTGEQTDWDLLCNLAGHIGYRVYVDGYDLHFEPLPNVPTEKNTDQYLIRWQPPGLTAYPQANVSDDLIFERALSITKGVTVEVMSWQMKKKAQKHFVSSYPVNTAKGTKPGTSQAKNQVYRIIRPGLTPQAALKLAQTTYHNIVQHEMKMSCSTAGDNILHPTMMIRVEGTDSPFDQMYYCDSIRRSLSYENGYTMSISAKNRSPLLQVTQ